MKNRIGFSVLLALILSFVSAVLLLGACSGRGSNAPEASSGTVDNGYETFRIRIGHNNSTEHFIHQAAEALAKKVGEATGGKVVFEIYPAETIGTDREMADAIVAGSGLDVFIGATGSFTQHYTRLTFFEGPYVFESRQHLSNFYHSDFMQKTLNAELAKNCNVQSIGQIYYGTRHVTSNKIARTPAEFKALKIRAPKAEMIMDTVAAMGAAATPVEFSETYLALQQGVVDGQENPPASIAAMKFDEVQKYLILTGHIVQQNHILLAEYTRRKASPKLLDLLLKTAEETGEEYMRISWGIEDNLLKELGKTMQIVEVDQSLFRAAMQPVYKKWIPVWGQDLMDAIAAAR
ncbi:MAG: DctP family TRAP transporter solute-binding subunit [Treponema sp.]|jgi:tripartite ATP-independent transporter DctP family solute receptor|nr:DctP family TRAP transporter solute-binding subunit [Treponema sp.]